MGAFLNAEQRRHLDGAVQRARTAAERAAVDALGALAVAEPSRPAYLSDDDNSLRLALREKARQLGDDTARSGAVLTNLMREVAYEQWHRLLFARFLERNGLLRHPEFRDTSLTLDDCTDLADDLGEPDGWSVAARFASEILPGVFRLDDPAVQVRFATEHRLELEKILLSLPSEVFETEDALGWVYQFWQTAEKKRVNESGVKIGGADLSPVTQLFTENYMVRFLLENSLGAWWAARHPDSPLLEGWEYLRRVDDGTPAAGTFDEWPATAAEVTVMDPCCGSGHFLVAMFGMLWRMRAEEEGLSPAEAQDAVLRENLHGLELDPRCTQIATFNVALEAWKQGGFRDLPAPQVACSGVPVRGTREEWVAHANGDSELSKVLGRLHSLFRNADTLGSLISPRPDDVDGALFGSDMSIGAAWGQVRATLGKILERETQEATVLGHAAADVVLAAGLLARKYTLVATNPPFLLRGHQSDVLRSFLEANYPLSQADLATAFYERVARAASSTFALVLPQSWTSLRTYRELRRDVLQRQSLALVGRLGAGAFSGISGEIVQVVLQVGNVKRPDASYLMGAIDATGQQSPDSVAIALREREVYRISQEIQFANPESRLLFAELQSHPPLQMVADIAIGLHVGDDARFRRQFWEVGSLGAWARFQMPTEASGAVGGLDSVMWWPDGGRLHRENPSARVQGDRAWGKTGIAIRLVRPHPVSPYWGDLFGQNIAAVIPHSGDDLGALWHFLQSADFADHVRAIDGSLKVTPRVFGSVSFDKPRWRQVADKEGGLPSCSSNDPTQWLFRGAVPSSKHPLQVAVARLLGYRWPDQEGDHSDRFADADGIAALQSLPNEPDLATRLRELLAAAYGSDWSSALERTLVTDAGGKNGRLEDWLRDAFFAQHVKVFDNRPFLWHIWDGRKDGFSAIVNYHRLDHKALEKLTFTSLGAWIERQRHETAAGRAGADARLAAAEALQEKLKLILNGVPPYDIYIRWKELHEQPIGWNPDLDDGVRLNIRPFVTAGVLRAKVNVHWRKDRGTNADGSERLNDLHPTLAERRDARRQAGVGL